MTTLGICRGARTRSCALLAFPLLLAAGCSGLASPERAEETASTRQAVSGASDAGNSSVPSPPAADVPCAARAYAIVANTGSVVVNAASLVDAYQSSAGAYGGSNAGEAAFVEAATSVTNHGTIDGNVTPNTPAGFAVVPVPSNAINLPLGSHTPGSVTINNAAGNITLAPGDYVVTSVTVNAPGAIRVSPAGPVRIWVTGNLNLGGSENLNGVPNNLAFLVTSAGSVNVNSGGALYGSIYAPTSSINVNSNVFGSVIGSSVTLNSSAAVHYDQGLACPQPIARPLPSGGTPLPAPPTEPGCYIGTLNGWLQVPCANSQTVVQEFGHPAAGNYGLLTPNMPANTSGGPLVYGQVETTIEDIFPATAGGSPETNIAIDGATNANAWGIQNNTNRFDCLADPVMQCEVQFTIQTDGSNGNTAVCITNASNITTSLGSPGGNIIYDETCVDQNGANHETDGGGTNVAIGRIGPLQPFDFANVAGFTLPGATPMLALVAQFSWVSSQNPLLTAEKDVPNQIPGLYSVVIPDVNGLNSQWTTVTGGILGEGGGSEASFANAEVLTHVSASDCLGDVSASGPICAGQPALSSSTGVKVASPLNEPSPFTAETDNLGVFQFPTVSFPNQNLAVTDLLSSTGPTCLSNQPSHLFIRDYQGDFGGVPSNSGGTAFWNSPDVFVVPHGGPVPAPTSIAADFQVVTGQLYDVYLQLHNEFGCNAVPAPINVLIGISPPDMGVTNWQPITGVGASSQFVVAPDPTMGGNPASVPAFNSTIVGPFEWTPQGSGHMCMLAGIAGGSETEPQPTVLASQVLSPLPAAYNSNQVAQHNLQIGGACSYTLSNTTTNTANLLFGISVTPATPVPGASNGPAVSLTFSDPSMTWFQIWSAQALAATSPTFTVSTTAGVTTVTLEASYLALDTVPLLANTGPVVNIQAGQGGGSAPPTVQVSTLLTNPVTGQVLEQNGGSCTGTASIVVP